MPWSHFVSLLDSKYEMFSFIGRARRSNLKFYTCEDAENSLSLDKGRSSAKKDDSLNSADTIRTAL